MKVRVGSIASTLLLLAVVLASACAQAEEAAVRVGVQPPDGGVVEGAGSYTPGSSCTLRAMPSEGWRFVEWRGEPFDGSTQNPLVFFVSEDVELTAVFEPLPKPAAETGEEPSGLDPIVQAVTDHLLLFAGMLLLVAVAVYVWRRGRGEPWDRVSRVARGPEAGRRVVTEAQGFEVPAVRVVEEEKPSIEEIGVDGLQRLAANPDTWLGRRFRVSAETLAEASIRREVRLEGVERLLDLGVLEWKDTGTREVPLVGRGEELERVLEAMSERPFHIFVYGSEGTGKSRLVREALEGAGVSCVSSELSSVDERPPLAAALRDLLERGRVRVRGSTVEALLAGLFSLRGKRCLLLEDCHLVSGEEMAKLGRAVIDARVSTVLTGRDELELDGFKHFALRDYSQDELMWIALAYSAVHGGSLRSDGTGALVSCAARNGQASALLPLIDEAFERGARTPEEVAAILGRFVERRVEMVLGGMNPLMREFLGYVRSGGGRGVTSDDAYGYYAQLARQVGYSSSKASFWKASSELSKLNLIHSRRGRAETRYYFGPLEQGDASRHGLRETPRPGTEEREAAACAHCGTTVPRESIYCPSCGRKIPSLAE